MFALQPQGKFVRRPTPGAVVVCGAKKEAKAARRQLELQREELASITAELQSPAGPSRSLAAVVASLQRIGGNLEDIACTADQLSSSSSSSSSSDSDCEETQPLTGPSTSKAVQMEPTEEIGYQGEGRIQQAVQAALSSEEAGEASSSPPTAAAVEFGSAHQAVVVDNLAGGDAGPSDGPAFWSDALDLLGAACDGRVAVCQGKACARAGSAQVMQELSVAAEQHPGMPLNCFFCTTSHHKGSVHMTTAT